MKENFGFVYIWYDRKRKMFYIGCHSGDLSDGYICSSTRMRNAYRRRPFDFKRRILKYGIFDKSSLLDEEYKWLSLISTEELNIKYYNAQNHRQGHWSEKKDFSGTKHPMYGKTHSKEARKKISEAQMGRVPWNKGKTGVYSEDFLQRLRELHKGNLYNLGKKRTDETRKKMSDAKKGCVPWNKGKTGVYSDEVLKKMSNSSKGHDAWNKGKVCPQLSGEKNGAKKLKGKSWKINQETGKREWIIDDE